MASYVVLRPEMHLCPHNEAIVVLPDPMEVFSKNPQILRDLEVYHEALSYFSLLFPGKLQVSEVLC